MTCDLLFGGEDSDPGPIDVGWDLSIPLYTCRTLLSLFKSCFSSRRALERFWMLPVPRVCIAPIRCHPRLMCGKDASRAPYWHSTYWSLKNFVTFCLMSHGGGESAEVVLCSLPPQNQNPQIRDTEFELQPRVDLCHMPVFLCVILMGVGGWSPLEEGNKN